MGTAFILDDDANHNTAARAEAAAANAASKAAADKVAKERAEAAAAAGQKFYFKAHRSGPSAPLLVLDSYWEAKEMKSNPEYYRVHADGTPFPDEEAGAETRILFTPPAAEKRPTLRLKK
jgi:hypothetical protein